MSQAHLNENDVNQASHSNPTRAGTVEGAFPSHDSSGAASTLNLDVLERLIGRHGITASHSHTADVDTAAWYPPSKMEGDNGPVGEWDDGDMNMNMPAVAPVIKSIAPPPPPPMPPAMVAAPKAAMPAIGVDYADPNAPDAMADMMNDIQAFASQINMSDVNKAGETIGRAEPQGHDYAAVNPAQASKAKLAKGRHISPSVTSASAMPSLQRWYGGKLPRGKCEAAVKASMQGDFMVRRSNSSLSEILCVNDNGEAVNFSIQYNDDGGVQSTPTLSFVGRTFKSLDMVIKYLKLNALKGRGGDPLYLQCPAILAPWYLGAEPNETLIKLVRQAAVGDFCVRKGSKGYQYKFLIRADNSVHSTTVTRDKATNEFRYDGRSFLSLEQVVDDMRQTPIAGADAPDLCLRYSARL